MTAHVLGLVADGPGKARTTEAVAMSSRTMKLAVYDYDMGTDNYIQGGNDISAIWADFPAGILYIGIEQKDTNTAGDRREFGIDYSAQTLIQYEAFSDEEEASNQTVVALRLLVVGYA
jgi:hypothetical protein